MSIRTLQNTRLRQIVLSRPRGVAADTMEHLKRSGSLSELMSNINHGAARVRREVAAQLRFHIDSPGAIDALGELLMDQHDVQVRWQAALSLGDAPYEKTKPYLENLFSTRFFKKAKRQGEKFLLASLILRNEQPRELPQAMLSPKNEVAESVLASIYGRMEKSLLVRQFLEPENLALRNDPVITDKIQAALLAKAIADAMGVPVEFLSLEEIHQIGRIEHFLEEPIRPLRAGQPSDDTEMAVDFSESLVRMRRFDPYDLGKILSERCLQVDLRLAEDSGYGGSKLRLREIYAGLDWRLVGLNNNSNGCAPAMRVVPLGLVYRYASPDQLKELAMTSAVLTQRGNIAQAGAAAVAYLAARAIKGDIPNAEHVVREAADLIEDVSLELAQEIRRIPGLLSQETDFALGTFPLSAENNIRLVGMKSIGVVPSALYCFFKSPQDLRRVIIRSVNTQGDSDSIGAIAGALAGAYNGLSSIPAEWRDELVDANGNQFAPYLMDLGERLARVNPIQGGEHL